MADYITTNIRNIALIGHGSEGKTTLTEAMLYAAGLVDRQGRVEDGTTMTDFDPEETRRKCSISAATAPVDWNGKIINVVDVPGYFDFVGEMIGPLRVVETAVIVVDAVGGLSVGAEKAWITPVRMVWGACLLSTRWIAITRTSTRFRRSCARSTATASCRFCCRWAKARPSAAW